jgi:hypothetical protein
LPGGFISSYPGLWCIEDPLQAADPNPSAEGFPE